VESLKGSTTDSFRWKRALLRTALDAGVCLLLAAVLSCCEATTLLTEVEKRVQAAATSVPGMPAISNVLGGNQSATVSWAGSAGASSYNLYLKQGATVSLSAYERKIPGAVSPQVINGLQNGTQYAFIVTAANSAGESDASSIVTAKTWVDMPRFSPLGGDYTSAQTVTISCSTDGAEIRYTTDGNMPSESTGTVYSTTLSISSNTTLKAIAYAPGMTDSAVGTAVYSFWPPSAPTISDASGGLNKVTITWAPVSGATSYYLYWKRGTTVTPTSYDVKAPGAVSPQVVGGLDNGTEYAFLVTAVNAFGEGAPSAVMTASTYSQVVAPAFSPPGGSYASAQNVAISSSTNGAIIYYTLDGSTPSRTTGTQYSAPVNVSSNATLRAIACASAMADSPVSAATYSFGLPAAPVISSAVGGSYRVAVSWGAVSGALSYNIYWKQGLTVTTASYDGKTTGALSPQDVSGLVHTTQYAFIVTAVNYNGEGAPSPTKTATTELEWTARTLAGSDYWGCIVSSSDGTRLAAGVFGGDVWTSTDSGANWTDRTSVGGWTWSSIASSVNGTQLAVCGNPGNIRTSADGGANWTTRTDAGSRYWTSITSSSDGTRLAACVYYTGDIYISADSGLHWYDMTLAGSRSWNGIASSLDGMKLAACVKGGDVYTSTDEGAHWTDQTLAGSGEWTSIASSADGTRLAACAVNGDIWTSTDSGATWTDQSQAGFRSWQSIAMSSDGTKMAACVNGGDIWTSTDSGVHWTDQTSAGSRSWRSITMSSDGTKLAACVFGGGIYTGQ
jgi:hypothetical protein